MGGGVRGGGTGGVRGGRLLADYRLMWPHYFCDRIKLGTKLIRPLHLL